jgi:flagellar motor switch protein FliM
MSGAVMSDDAVAALVDAARRGELPNQEQRPAPRRTRIRKVDFTRPAKFTSDQERRIGRVVDTFCRTASTRLAAELRMPVELELINSAQLTWANAHALLPDESTCGLIGTRPVGTRMLLGAEQPLVLAAIERLMGGSGDEPVAERKLTEIDAVVARLFFQRLLNQLSAVFQDAAGIGLELESIEAHRDTEQMAGVSEPTLAATIEVRHDPHASTIVLLMPHPAFAPMADAFTGATAERHGQDTDPTVVEAAVAAVDLELQAEVGAVELPIEAIMAIAPGDVLRLGASAAGGVALTVGGLQVGRAAPGRVGSHRAVQVLP